MKLGNRILGPATCVLSESEAVPGVIELSSFVVSGLHRRKGAGNKMMDTICEEADKSGKVIMLMPIDCQWLQSWYSSHGFVKIQDEPVLMARPPYK